MLQRHNCFQVFAALRHVQSSGGKILSHPPLQVIHHASSFPSPLPVKFLLQRLQHFKYLAIALQGKTSSFPWILQLRQQTEIVCQVTLAAHVANRFTNGQQMEGIPVAMNWNRYFVFWYSPQKPEEFPPVWSQGRFRKLATDGSLSKEIFPIGQEFKIGTAFSLSFLKLLFRLQPLLFFLHWKESSITWATYHLQQIISLLKLIQSRKVVSPC